MSKTKKTTEPHYELLYLISNKFTDEEVKPIAEKVEAIILANEGQITYRENWGKKKLAYPVKHFAYGYYLYVEFDVLPLNLAKIERSIRMAHDILRHQIVTRPVRTIDQKEKPRQIVFEDAKKDSPAIVPAKPVKSEYAKKDAAKPEITEEAKPEAVDTKIESVAETLPEAEVKAPKKVKVLKDSKASMEELDAKLDKILETNDLL